MLIRQIAASCGVIGLLFLPASAQENTSQSPPPILKGGIVHQLRSLSAEALDSLKIDKEKEAPPTAPPPSRASNRASLRQGIESLWGGHKDEGEASAPQRQHLRFRGSQPPGAYAPRTSGGIARPAALAPERLPEVVAPNQAMQGLRASSPPTPIPSMSKTVSVIEQRSGKQRTNTPAEKRRTLEPESLSKVHIEEDLPAAVTLSLRDKGQVDSGAEREPMLTSQVPQVSRVPLPGSEPTPPENDLAQENLLAQDDVSAQDDELVQEELAQAEAPDRALSDTQQAIADDSSWSLADDASEPSPPSLDTLPSAASLPAFDSEEGTEGSLVATREDSLPILPEMPSLPEPASTQVETSIPEAASNSPTAVSVPTQMVSRPSAEQRPATLPKLPTASDELPESPKSTHVRNSVTPTQPNTTRLSHQPAARTSPTANLPAQRQAAKSAEERLKLETPRIEVVLNGPADMPVGRAAEYEVVVSNRDNIDLSGLVLRLDVPAGVTATAKRPSRGEIETERSADGMTLLTWIFDDLRAGTSASAPIGMVAESPRNFAVAMEWTLMPLNGAAEVEVLSPQLEIALEGPSEVNFGEANTYRLHVRNPGNALASNVVARLSAEPYGASSAEIGDIPAGGEETIDVELTFSQKGAIGIAASAVGAGDLLSSTKIDVLVKQPNLVASMLAPQMVYHGRNSDYQISIRNTGDAEARDITAQCVIPAGAKPVRLPPGARLDDNRITWPIPVLKPGKSEEVALQLSLSREGENRVYLECSTVNGLATNCAAATHVEAIVDLKLLVNDPIAPAPVGSEVVYELELTNRGSKAANNVVVIAQFSEGIEPTRGEGHAFRVIPGQLLFEPIARIPAGKSLVLKVLAKAETDGTHRFRAEVRSNDSELKLVQEESTHYLEAAGRIASPPGASVYR